MMDMSPLATQIATAAPLQVARPKSAVSVVGLGYVGAVSTACLSSLGHRVVGVDVDPTKIAAIATGVSPIHERDLGTYLARGVDAGLVSATDDLAGAVRDTDVTFVSVGTPTAPDGGCDYRYIEAAARSMAEGLAAKDDFHVFVMRCSIPPGTTLNVMARMLADLSGKTLGEDFGVCFNPEFLREGVAIEDFFAPPKTVIGATCDRSAQALRDIYAPVDADPIITSIETAEMVKYVDNVWHAAKVTFGNEIGRLCKPLGVDSHAVMDIFCQDTKLNLSPYYLKPGFAYGGSCLPKEVRAVSHIAEGLGVDLPMIGALDTSNAVHIDRAVEMARATGAKRVGIMGLAFKPGTDDLRESPILEVAARLHAEGIELVLHDPCITPNTPLEGQLAYVAHGSAGLAQMAECLPEMLTDDLGDLASVDALIVAQANEDYRDFVSAAGTTPVIDVVRLFAELPAADAYQGIGW